jgi:ketosteroid isomerase-like protein
VEVSQSGDLAYIVGSYEDSFKDAKGQPVTDRGKTLEVFKKQTDGSWKVVADMYSSDFAAPPA